MGVAVPYESKSRAEPAKMKFLAVLLLVALAYAEPEAAPDAKADAEAAPWYYGYYGHPGYYGWGGYPYAYGYWKRDAEQQQMVKREAEEEEAKPAMLLRILRTLPNPPPLRSCWIPICPPSLC